ncbi:MAG TPA: TauD/TfdA family dioxygenase [Stellaceae bacterium]|nr:TauD/TfdA family dioxygenase [Stellaceae bacterium]
MAIRVTPFSPSFGAEIAGVDLKAPLAAEDFATIEAAFHRYAVLVFPGQPLSDDQQVAFSCRFGPLETSPEYAGSKKSRLGRPEIADISNLDAEGRVMSAEDKRLLFNRGNQLWHTDSSFKYVPARCSLLSAREIPPSGGETEFADLRAAYDALPEEKKRALDGLVVEHSIFRSRSQIGFSEFNEDIQRQLPPVPQLLVRRHAGSGRKTLYLASHASHVIGWPAETGRALVEELIAFATEPRFVYQHRWKVGDLVMWDDRCTMHRGRPYDDTRYRRDMHRTTVSDEINSVERERGTAAA